MSIKKKMEEAKEHVVDVETTEVVEDTNETENEEFMNVRVPKAKAYEMLANGEASEIEPEEPAEEPKVKKKIFTKDNLAKVGKGAGIAAAGLAALVTGIAIGKSKNGSDEVTFEDVPQALPDNNVNYQTTYETETDNVDVEI